MAKIKRYIAGLGTGYIVTFLTMIIGLWLTPYSLKYLTREEFAIFTLANDILVWLSLVDIGIASSLKVKISQLTGKSEEMRSSQLASTAFFAEIGVGIIILISGIFFALLFPMFFNVSSDLCSDARNVVLIFVLSTAIHIGLQTYSALLIAHQQIHIDNIIRIFLLLLRTVLIVIFLFLGWKMYSIAVANLVAVVISTILAGIRCRYSIYNIKIKWNLFSFEDIKQLAGMGLWFTVGGLAGILIESLDRVMAGKIISLESVTSLALTGRLYIIAYGLISQITNAARPIFGQMLGKGDIHSIKIFYDRILFVSKMMSVAIGLSIFAGNGIFVRWWVGEEIYGGFWLDMAFSANLVINCWILPNRAILVAGLVVKQNSLSRIIEGILNFILSIFLSYQIGLTGIIAGTALACVCSSFWYMPFLTAKLLQQENPVQYFWRQLKDLLFIICISIPIALIVRFYFCRFRSFWMASLAMSLSLLTIGCLFYAIYLTKEDRNIILRTVQNILKNKIRNN